MHSIDAELAGHTHKFNIKLQSLCGNGFSRFAVCMLAKPYYLGVNWPTTLRENKDRVHFFSLNFDSYNIYNKLLLCNSENGDIAWWNKINLQCGFSVFLEKRTKSCFYLQKTRKNRWVAFFKRGFSQPCNVYSFPFKYWVLAVWWKTSQQFEKATTDVQHKNIKWLRKSKHWTLKTFNVLKNFTYTVQNLIIIKLHQRKTLFYKNQTPSSRSKSTWTFWEINFWVH